MRGTGFSFSISYFEFPRVSARDEKKSASFYESLLITLSTGLRTCSGLWEHWAQVRHIDCVACGGTRKSKRNAADSTFLDGGLGIIPVDIQPTISYYCFLS